MSGTTAISSFSIVEAEMLESRSILRNLSRLYDISTDFLDHLAPPKANIDQDDRNIMEMQTADSDFAQDYKDFDEQIMLYLAKFRSEHQQYIRPRAVRRALFGPERDPSSSQSGLDLVLYLANLLIFAKHMIETDRGQKKIWDTLRELDQTQFPQLFLPSLIDSPSEVPTGESGLVNETFELALELRTQLAILCLERTSTDAVQNPEETLREVFYRPTEDEYDFAIDGWGIPGLGGLDGELSGEQQIRVEEQLNNIRNFFSISDQAEGEVETVDLDHLGATFSWRALVLQLLQWARLRHQELQQTIIRLGGISAIIQNIKAEIQQPNSIGERATLVARTSSRKSRSSFGQGRRRSSRKFDPNDATNDAGVCALKAKARQHSGFVDAAALPNSHSPGKPLPTDQELLDAQDVWRPIDDDDELPQLAEDTVPELVTTNEEHSAPDEPTASTAPQTSLDYVRLTQEAKKLDKENRAQIPDSRQSIERSGSRNSRSLFTRQPNAERIEFGDGFDGSQPTPGPSRKGKEPQRQQPAKRRRLAMESDSDDDTYESNVGPSQQARDRRLKAPIAKKVRIDATSSAPPSHQPPASIIVEIDESLSEPDAPEMTEVPPSTSTMDDVRTLAVQSTASLAVKRRRKSPKPWTREEEQAFIDYMAAHPQKYAIIQQLDSANNNILQGRTQVNLKDKARTLAETMIK